MLRSATWMKRKTAGLSPAAESLRPQLAEALKGSSTSVTPGQRRPRMRSILVALQIALSLAVLMQAALFTKVQRRFLSHDPGFETKQVIGVTLTSILTGFNPPVSFHATARAGCAA